MATTTPQLVLRKPASTDLVNVTTDISDNMDKLDAASQKVLGIAQVTGNQSGISGDTDLVGVTVTVTVGASRRIKVTSEVTVGATVTDDQAMLRIKEGATTLVEREGKVTSGRGKHIIATAWLTPTAGSHTYKASLQRVLGTGTLSAANALAPSTLVVEDMGAV